MKRRRISLLLAAAAALAGASASAQEDPTNIVADQIRAQGYKCDSPQSAKRDAQASIPGEAVWILQCESGSYRVRLTPDMAATVERLDRAKSLGSRHTLAGKQNLILPSGPSWPVSKTLKARDLAARHSTNETTTARNSCAFT